MYRIPQIPQPYKEDVELMKRGRKRKSTTTTRSKGVNIKNIINISRGGGGGRRRPPAFSPAVNVPYSNLFRPQLNEPRSTSVTSATYAEQNNNILASFRKSQEISEGKLNAKIDDMGSKLEESIMTMGQMINTKSFLQELEQKEQLQPKKPTPEELKLYKKQQQQQQQQQQQKQQKQRDQLYWDKFKEKTPKSKVVVDDDDERDLLNL
jgi:hypothetical protein